MSSNNSIKNLSIPNNCVAIGPAAYCVVAEQPNKVIAKYRLSQLAYDLWEKDPNPITKNDNNLITNKTCVLTNGCTNTTLKPGCVATCMIKVNNNAGPFLSKDELEQDNSNYIGQTLVYDGANWTSNTLMPSHE
jgi:hypothetical protein